MNSQMAAIDLMAVAGLERLCFESSKDRRDCKQTSHPKMEIKFAVRVWTQELSLWIFMRTGRMHLQMLIH